MWIEYCSVTCYDKYMPIVKKLNHDFFKKWTREMAYVLGFFAADGSMMQNKRGGHFIEFHITDRCVLVSIRKVLGSDHKISLRNQKKKHHRLSYRLQLGSREYFNDISLLGFTPNKSKIVRFPFVEKDFLGDFVRGYFDGDGCVFFKRYKVKDRRKMRWVFQTRFTSGSKQFLDGLHFSLREQGGVQRGFILEKSKNSGWELVLSHNDSVALSTLMYNNVPHNLFLPRKYRIFKRALRTLFGQKLEMRL